MAFEYILASLLAEIHAAGVLFLDGTGETVDVVCSDFTPYEMRVLGAYLGIYLKQVGNALDGWSMGRRRRWLALLTFAAYGRSRRPARAVSREHARRHSRAAGVLEEAQARTLH